MRQVLFLLTLVLWIVPSGVFAQGTSEVIRNYIIKLNVEKDGRVYIIETIQYDFGQNERHGIYRKIPYTKTNTDGKKFELDIGDVSVTDENDKKYSFTSSKDAAYLTLKIGDPDKTITGMHAYRISYIISGALTYFSDHDELYWNATGDEWVVPIEQSTVAVSLPSEIPFSAVTRICYTGSYGSTAQECLTQQDGSITFQTTKSLGLREGLTVVVGFPKDYVAVLEPKEVIDFWTTPSGRLLKNLLLVLLIAGVSLWYIVYPLWLPIRWYLYGRDPSARSGLVPYNRPVTASFDAPKTKSGRALTPAETGTLMDEHAELREIQALIVDLARRGYLKIHEKEKNKFTLEKSKATDIKLQPFERSFFDTLFAIGGEVSLKSHSLYEIVEDAKENLYTKLVSEGFFPKDPSNVRKFYAIIAGVALWTFNLPLVLMVLLFGRVMASKTLWGSQQANVARSLKNFLQTQERQLNFQAKNQMFFEKLLPYAVAFGVEKQWADRFADINLTQPEWYTTYRSGTFTMNSFSQGLHSSMNQLSSAATPVRSTSGFSSGSSGGFSGGGGGGGGGGSW